MLTDFSSLKPTHWDLKNTLFSTTREQRRLLKSEQIRASCSAKDSLIYVETNPLFSTLWHDVVLEEFYNNDIYIIFLKRDVASIIKSIYELGWYHLRDGDQWIVSQYSVNSLFHDNKPEADADAFDKIIGHIVNVELYGQKIREIAERKHMKVIDLMSEELFRQPATSLEKISKLCSIPFATPTIKQCYANKESARRKYAHISYELCADRWFQFLASNPFLDSVFRN